MRRQTITFKILLPEHFLRRQFAWYNGELFLQDIPDHCKVIVCLADADEICNAQKVKAHIDIHNGETPSVPRCMKYLKESSSPKSGSSLSSNSSLSSASSLESSSSGKKNKIDVVYWEGEGHGSCLFNTTAWHDLRRAMRKQEQQIRKEKSL